jgi:alanyl-tRNA synthetase
VDVPGFDRLLDEQRERSRRAAVVGRGGLALGGVVARGKGTATARAGSLQGVDAVARAHDAAHDAGRTARTAPDVAPGIVRARTASWTRVKPRLRQKWVGYDTTRAETDILAFQRTEGGVGLVLHENPFYAESGGQVSDRGRVVGEGWEIAVDEVRKIEGRTAVFGVFEGPFEPTKVEAVVDQGPRRDTERNHTATHLLHAALRTVLGTHAGQAGSVVSPDRLRFDFTHHHPIAPEQLARIEDEVNRRIWENLDVTTAEMKYPDALKLGAMAFFSEKYGDVVRVVTVPGVSLELCGGTHVRTTGQIGLARLISESGVGAGVRRVEMLTGPGAFAWLDAKQRQLEAAADQVGSAPEHLARKVELLVEERRKLEKRVEELIRGGGAPDPAATTDVNGTVVSVTRAPTGDRNEIGAMVDAFRARTKSGVAVIVATGDRPGIHVGVTDDLVARGITAPDLVNRIAALSGGKGGGRPHFASAGAGDADRLDEVARRAPDIVSARIAEVQQTAPAGMQGPRPRSA